MCLQGSGVGAHRLLVQRRVHIGQQRPFLPRPAPLERTAQRFAELVSRLPEVQEAHALTGEMDYILKVVTPDLKSLANFVNQVLLPHEAVQHVKTAIVLETLKESPSLPLEE